MSYQRTWLSYRAAIHVKRAGAVGIAMLCLVVAGCDKCGNRVNFNTPAIQHSCEDTTQPSR